MTNKRLDYLDCVKGFAILLVILVHIYASNVDINRGTLVVWIHSFHMPLFFIVSGMLIKYKEYVNIKKFIISKIKHILLPYFIFSFCSLIIIIIVNKCDTKYFLSRIIDIFILKGINMWFLQTLFFSEIFFILLNKKIKKEYIKIILIVLLFIGSLFITKENGFLLRFGARVFIALGFIYFGYIFMSMINNTNISNKYLIVLLAIHVLLSKYNGIVDLNNLIFSNKFLYILNSLVGSSLIIILFRNIQTKNNVLRFFGKNSLLLYVTHGSLLYLFEKFINKDMNGYISGLVPFILILLIEIPIIQIINKNMPWMLGKLKNKDKFNKDF